jgi:phosphate starvation-inducible protein PhoH
MCSLVHNSPPVIRRHTFEPTDNRRLAHLCGAIDGHLRAIEAALGVTLVRREASFRIDGARAAVARAAERLCPVAPRQKPPPPPQLRPSCCTPATPT